MKLAPLLRRSAITEAIAMGATEGFMKVVFDGDGAHMVGERVTEMIQRYTVARVLETTEHPAAPDPV